MTILIVLCTLANELSAQKDSVQARIVLIGDAGSLKNGRHPVVSAVRNRIKLDSITTVLYLGDNLYTYGLPDDAYSHYTMAATILDSQTHIVANTPARAYFLPGNHDWDHEGPDGWNAVMREQNYIDAHGGNNVQFYPKDGCPGPEEVSLSNDVVLIMMDSQWWLHLYDKPGIESDCPYKTKEEVLSQLDEIVTKNARKLIVFACHHPFKSDGIHGGYFTLKQHIFPLTDASPKMYVPMPLIGSIYPITRGIFGTAQDLKHPAYQNMIRDINKVLKAHPNVIYAAGHEHNLQLIQDSSYTYITSGAGTNKTRVSKSKHQLYGSEENGFATMEIMKDKNVKVAFYEVKDEEVNKTFEKTVWNFAKLPRIDSGVHTATVTPIEVPFEDSVLVQASEKYGNASPLKRFIFGNNYREEWSTKVKLKVFNLRKEKGGLRVTGVGGGKQTASLRMRDKNGKEWSLRSIDKNPEKAMPEFLRGSVAQDIVSDMISASHPYGALAVPDLAKALGVPVASPQFFFVPDDPAFGVYRSRVANTVCMLEDRDPVPGADTKSTQKVMSKVLEDNDNRIDQPLMLRARLLDMLIGDWDRHFDQWKWATRDTGKGKVYYPVPRDRDQVFFGSDGRLIKTIASTLFPYLKGFSADIRDVNWFNWEERDIDRFFLNRLDRQRWVNIIDSFQHTMTDSLLAVAVNRMPPEIVAIDGAEILTKLKGRRDQMMEKGLEYYRFLSKTVTVLGTNDNEYFKVTTVDDTLQVSVYKRDKKTQKLESVMYERKFDPRDTKEILMYGLNSDDYFDVDEKADSRIRLRLIGGKGSDTFNVKGNIRNYLYDMTTSENYVAENNRSRVRTSSDPHVNDYTPVNFKYNLSHFPQFNFGFNAEDKFLVGLGFSRRTFGFRKEPFATEQKFSTLYAFNSGAYQIKYQGQFNQAIGKLDIVARASLLNPALDNFFGFGNETPYDQKKGIDFYRVRYKYLEGQLFLRKRFNPVLQVLAGPVVNHYWDRYENNQGKIMGTPSALGLDSNLIYTRKTYAGGKLAIIINNLDNVLLPTRGINWVTQFEATGALTKAAKPFTALTSDMTVHAALSEPAKLVTILRVGGGHIFSKNYEYFQGLTLGANNYLRGYRKDRFTGSSLFYSGLEVRVKLFESKSYVFPGAVGLIAFNELGRVWQEGEDSRKWHYSYGGGMYYAAYNYVLLSATIGLSGEDNLFNFSIGTKFNLTF
ncbi:BamA/TamA family outer membrane protein [Sediminibacterium sp. WSJ-3]|nr:BamA/TamA family outer membrane protein [Sediminibacterium soli]